MQKIKWLLKSSKTAYLIYNILLSQLLKAYGIFLKIDNKLILINSYGGAKYDDSPRDIYEYMKESHKYSTYKVVWAFDKLPANAPKDIVWVKNNTIKYFKIALKSKYWITNSSIERGLKIKKKSTIYINTWHGSALKKMGADTGENTKKLNVSNPDYFYCQSEYDKNIFMNAFKYPASIMKKVGLPRNDILSKNNEKKVEEIKKKLSIPKNKKVILYAPTFRDYATNIKGNYLAPKINIDKWKKALSKEYVVLFRAHYEVSKIANIKYDDFIINATDYEELNDLLIVSDILVSDYSSIMIDYSILERPIFAYCYDIEEFEQKRGLYLDLRKTLPNGVQETENQLLDKIMNLNIRDQKKRTIKFKNKFVEEYGHATEYIDKIIKTNNAIK